MNCIGGQGPQIIPGGRELYMPEDDDESSSSTTTTDTSRNIFSIFFLQKNVFYFFVFL